MTIYTNTAANQSFKGGSGDDTYQYPLAGGADTISDLGGLDTIALSDPDNLFPGSWNAYYSGSNLVLNFGSGGVLTILNQRPSATGVGTIEKVAMDDWVVFNLCNGLTGGAGHDVLVGADNSETMAGNGGIDVIFAGGGSDTVSGGYGDDEIYGGAGNDRLSGNSDYDMLWGGAGSDILDGGAQWDQAVYLDQTGPIIANLSGLSRTVGTATIGANRVREAAGTVDTLINVENIQGSRGNDIFFGGRAEGASFEGFKGNDTIYGGGPGTWVNLNFDDSPAGIVANLSDAAITVNGVSVGGLRVRDGWGTVDTIVPGSQDGVFGVSGSGGNDYIQLRGGWNGWTRGGDGNDTIRGGSQMDTVSYDDDQGEMGILANLTTTAVTLNGVTVAAGKVRDEFGGTDTLASIENIIGSARGDVVLGSGANNRLEGGAGADTLKGGAGNDTLIGGSGRDVLAGGSGSDVFDFDSLSDLGKGTSRDVVTDFAKGVDRLDLSGIDASGAQAGDQAFTFVSGFSGMAGQVMYAAGVVSLDTNGDKVADYQIQLTGTVPAYLDYWDFVL